MPVVLSFCTWRRTSANNGSKFALLPSDTDRMRWQSRATSGKGKMTTSETGRKK